MVREITQDEISQYERDGAICLRGLFDPSWVARIQDALERLLQTDRGKRGDLTAPGSSGRFNNATFMWRFDPDFRAFVFESPAAEIARQMMRSRTSRFFYDHLFVKEPRTRETTPWHHIDAQRGKYEFLSWDVEPGDCLVHHSLAIHGSSGNGSATQRRRALATRWVGDDAVYAPAPGSFNLLLDATLTPGQPFGGEKFPLVVDAR